MAFLATKNENRLEAGSFVTGRFGRVPERFLLSVRIKSIIVNFAN